MINKECSIQQPNTQLELQALAQHGQRTLDFKGSWRTWHTQNQCPTNSFSSPFLYGFYP